MAEEETRAVVHCDQCKKPMAGKPHGAYQEVSPGGSWWGVEYTLMECTGCAKPFVVSSHSPWYDDFGDWDDKCWSPPEQILPALDEAIDGSVPKPIAASYLEARRCLRGQNFTAAALMCRRTIEIVCKHFNASGRDLDKKLHDLKVRLVIDERMHGWADRVLRHLGNKGAHDAEDEIKADDAADAVEFTKAIVWHLFVFEAAFHRHMERRPPKLQLPAPAASVPAPPRAIAAPDSSSTRKP
jgi:hypothetical protein